MAGKGFVRNAQRLQDSVSARHPTLATHARQQVVEEATTTAWMGKQGRELAKPCKWPAPCRTSRASLRPLQPRHADPGGYAEFDYFRVSDEANRR